MSQLIDPPRLLFRETAQSYLGRCAGYYGCTTINEFCRDYALDQAGIQRGEREPIEEFASLTGADVRELLRWSPLRVTYRVHRLGEHDFEVDIGPRCLVMECPVCARRSIETQPHLPADIAVYGRAEWVTGYIEACDEHNVRLISRRETSSVIERADPAYNRAMLLDELDDAAVVPAEPTDFERYALANLRGEHVRTSDILDDIPLRNQVRLFMRVGRDVAAHRSPGMDLEARDLLDLGFRVLIDGEQGLRALFAELRTRLDASEMARSIVPQLLDFVGRPTHESLDLLRKRVAQLLFESLPYPEGHLLLGIRSPRRYLHTFESARKAYGVPRGILETFARGTPGLALRWNGRPNDAIIDPLVADRTFLGRTPFVSAGQLAVMHGRSRRQVGTHYTDLLVDAGIITPISDPAFVGEPPLFSLPAVDAAIRSFQSAFRTVTEEPPNLVDLKTAAARTKISIAGILTLLAGRQVANVALLEGKPFSDSIRVDTHELVAVVTGTWDWITPEDAAEQLGLKTNGLRPLMEARYLACDDPVRTDIKLGRKWVVRQSEVDRFKRTYAPLSEVKALTGCRSRRAISKLGIEPKVLLEIDAEHSMWVAFYERATLPQTR